MVAYAYATPQTQIGLAIETTRGTPEAPKFWLPVMAPKYKPDIVMIEDKTLQGSMVTTYDLVRGQRYDGHGWDGYPYLDSFPVLVRALLGSSDTLTAAPTPTTLASAATAGSNSVDLTATVANGSYIVIGSGGSLESHYVTAVSGSSPYSATLQTPLLFNQPSGATVTGLTKHEFSLLNNSGEGNQPPSVTLTDYDGEEWRQLPMGQLDKLTVKGTGTTLVEYTCSWFANPATTPTTPTASYTGTQAPPGWSSQILLGGTQIPYVVDWEFDFARGVKPIPALTGTEAYFMYFAGPLQANFKLTVVDQTGAPELVDYLNNTEVSLDFTFFDTQAGNQCTIHSSSAKFKTGEVDRSKEWVEVPLTGELLPSASDALAGGVSPVLITVGNAQTTAY